MTEFTPWVTVALLLLALVNVCLLVVLWRRPAPGSGKDEVLASLHNLGQANERRDRDARSELRTEVGNSARDTRVELSQGLSLFQQALLAQSSDVARTQNEQIDSFRVQLAAMQQQVAQTLQAATQSQTQAMMQSRDAQDMALKRFADALNEQLRQMAEGNERRLGEVRQSVELKLTALQEGNEKKLDQMRATVDEKLHATLEARLGESFKQVADRLEQVHKGLGEMQTLAAGVGDLKHLLSNVKTRGMFGEAQLGALLEQVFAPDQYGTQVVTRPGSKNPVDFAIKLPGKSEDGTPLWLPIDAKFPNEDYERLLEAQGRADAVAAEAAGKALETRIRLEAKSIADKYVEPPHTTDFAILFLPTEGLYAEVLRRPGLMESLQRDHRITLAGPTTLMAMLNALQMGFRTLALEKRSSEVWQVLGAVKTEFSKFGDVLAKVKNQTQTVLNTLSQAETRTNVMTRALRSVEALPETQAAGLLPGLDSLGPDNTADLGAGRDADRGNAQLLI
jgi:DNA recombination protein RmuC